MKQFNKIAHLLVLLFFAVSLVYFLSFDSLKGIFGVESLSTSSVVSFLLIGLTLYLISWGTSALQAKNLMEQIDKKEVEKRELKAKMYDLEQGIKLKNIERKIEQKDQDKDSSSVIRPRQNFK
ncbi:hypothetical protein [Cecembia lonarensis]|uniref:Lipopolysaccharide assembly protein A domain-containing protein n=1 Tax=Cecembia lonarensis (strain CCUG 58316 / KCTC 22772 / LW9) TaxID=1225176 RepID=K1L1D0_CECL9|nr:hypothetical protein [Cecembia lonarensis]EKB48566.1 hypothetical protein B879_02791 [Cecembia lonarensis LW9]